jgi:hypothetical protein
MIKAPKHDQSRLHDEEWLVSEQSSKGDVEALAPKGPYRGKDITGLPKISQQS